jgi:hypothetical protein
MANIVSYRSNETMNDSLQLKTLQAGVPTELLLSIVFSRDGKPMNLVYEETVLKLYYVCLTSSCHVAQAFLKVRTTWTRSSI